MITKVYAHIRDEDVMSMLKKFENAFYAVNRDLKNAASARSNLKLQLLDLAALIDQLQRSPELTQIH